MDEVKVIKIGGAVIEEEDKLNAFLKDFHSLSGKKILIHGGGRTATLIAEQMGVTSKWHEGRRITDDQLLEIVIMTYGGLVNKRIVTKLQSLNTNAIGITGSDGNLMTSVIREKKPVDYGWVGDPENVNTAFLQMLLQNDLVPVIAPLTHDGNGLLLNTNADTMTFAISTYLTRLYLVKTVLCFELEGVLEDTKSPSTLIDELDENKFQLLKQNGIVDGGMIPKLENAFKMVKQGVSSVRILHYNKIGLLDTDNLKSTIIR